MFSDQVDFDTLIDDYAQKLKDSRLLTQTGIELTSEKIEEISSQIDPLLLLKLCEEVIKLDENTYNRILESSTHKLHFAAQLLNWLLDVIDENEFERIKNDKNHFAYYIANILEEEVVE